MTISGESAPAGDIRKLGAGDVLYVKHSARERSDWSRVTDAIRQAVSRGCAVVWLS